MNKLQKSIGLGLMAALFAIVTPLSTYALTEEDVSETPETTDVSRTNLAEREAELKARNDAREAKKTERTEKRAAAKVERCVKKQDRVKAIVARMAGRAENKNIRFTKIADKAKEFYVKKGIVVENYDALVADVEAKKVVALAAIEDAKVPTFDCETDHSRGQAQAFHAKHKASLEALKAYRISIKNLLTAIKTAHAESKTETNQ